MPITLGVNIKGLQALEKNFSNPRVVAIPLRRFLLRSGDYVKPRVQRRIKKGPPLKGHSPGKGRASVRIELDSSAVPRWVKVFSNLFHIFVYEYGAKARNQKARKPFRQTLRRSRGEIYRFAKEAAGEIVNMLMKKS